MLLTDVFAIPIGWSLLAIGAILGGAIAASWRLPRERPDHEVVQTL
jgi:hypothetical protein